jgi:polyisoprenoid-binding protein YceI
MLIKPRTVVTIVVLMTLWLAACAPGSSPTPAATPADEAAAAEATAEPTTVVEEQPTEAPAPAEESVAATDTALSGQRTFAIVPAESKASYIVDEEFFGGALAKYGMAAGIQDTVGSTQAILGQFQLNFDDLSAPLGDNRFQVDLSTLESDQSLRDGWIRDNGPSFGQYPDAVFVADRLENAPTEYTEGEEVNFQMSGDITIREITQPATFDVTARLEGDTVTGTALAGLRMSDFGIGEISFANTLAVADEFQVQIDFVARAE